MGLFRWCQLKKATNIWRMILITEITPRTRTDHVMETKHIGQDQIDESTKKCF